TIAATTWSEYKKYFEKDAALDRRFQPVKVEEPSEESAVLMLRGLASTYEGAHGVVIRDDAISAAVKLSRRYISGRQLPDKAVHLRDTATARVKMELATRPHELVALDSEIAGLEREKTALTRDHTEGYLTDNSALKGLEERLRAANDRRAALSSRWETQRNAVTQLREAQQKLSQAPAGTDLQPLRAAVTEARPAPQKNQGEESLLHPEVDPDVVAQVIANWTGIPVGKMRSDLVGAVLTLEEKLSQRVRGQPAAIRTVADVIQMAHAGIRNPQTPVGV